ncbi:zeta toxin family protein [Streptomyces sp. NPDC007896]|uniref:zeta toxin family protein n=1 Tax=Streptomyces sp. NPDC007896 TaxID=3364784 RepID=UPI0036EC1320
MLSERENTEVLNQVILPSATRRAVRQPRPVVVVVAGQPGAGKTWIADLVQAVLDHRGGAVRVGRDLYKPAHRHYPALLAADVRTVGALVRPDTAHTPAADRLDHRPIRRNTDQPLRDLLGQRRRHHGLPPPRRGDGSAFERRRAGIAAPAA